MTKFLDSPDSLSADDEVRWEDAESAPPPVLIKRPWTVLVADDDDDVHRVTAMVLSGMEVLGRPVRIIEARSAGQAVELLRAHPDTALVLMDVVMESEDAGLMAVRAIREALGNRQVRIVLRTGQPGHAPEREMVARYEIDGYEAKTELSAQRLITVATASIRAFDLISANRAKSEFLANMSHELRTPMHAILSFVEIARTRLRGDRADPGRMDSYLGRIDDSARRLMRLLDDLLDLAKLEEGSMRYDMDRHAVDRIIESALAELEPLMAKQGITYEILITAPDTCAWCDAFRLGQVLRNLLANAIKYTPSGGRITLQLADDEEKAEHLRIEVIDQGVGIPVGEEEAIFDKFVQSSRTRSGAGGTGLGLSICREIIQQHGGSIRARNIPQGGACVSFAVPRCAPRTAVTTRPPAP